MRRLLPIYRLACPRWKGKQDYNSAHLRPKLSNHFPPRLRRYNNPFELTSEDLHASGPEEEIAVRWRFHLERDPFRNAGHSRESGNPVCGQPISEDLRSGFPQPKADSSCAPQGGIRMTCHPDPALREKDLFFFARRDEVGA